MAEKRKAFHFDLDEEKLKIFFLSKSPMAYKNAWGKIRAFMENYGFKHTQYSGYESINGMSYYRAFNIIERLQTEFSWFAKCAQVATITEIGEQHDILQYLNENNHEKKNAPTKKIEMLSLTEEARGARQAADILNSQRDGNTDKTKDSEKGLL